MGSSERPGRVIRFRPSLVSSVEKLALQLGAEVGRRITVQELASAALAQGMNNPNLLKSKILTGRYKEISE